MLVLFRSVFVIASIAAIAASCGIEEKLLPGECRESSSNGAAMVYEKQSNDKFEDENCVDQQPGESSSITSKSSNSSSNKQTSKNSLEKINVPIDKPFYDEKSGYYLYKSFDSYCDCYRYEYWNTNHQEWLTWPIEK